MRFPHFLFTFASLALALAPLACSSSSETNCTLPPGPAPFVTLQAPCGLTITAFSVTGPCQKLGTAAMPEIEGTGSSGTCDVTVTLSNGAQAAASVTFTLPSCGSVEPSTPTLDFDAGACDAGTPADATAG